jgi:hypothetical protein
MNLQLSNENMDYEIKTFFIYKFGIVFRHFLQEQVNNTLQKKKKKKLRKLIQIITVKLKLGFFLSHIQIIYFNYILEFQINNKL